MQRLIDANRLLSEDMKTKYYHLPNGDIAIPLIDIEHAPTVDAAPMKHGRWINSGYACGENKYVCSVCGENEWRTDCRRMKYCMFCGAQMDLEENDAKEET